MRIALAWELGGGWGHVSRFAPVVRALRREGHEVVLFVRDPERTRPWIEGATVLPLPAQGTPPATPVADPESFAGILHNVGWHSDEELTRLAEAWMGAFDEHEPELVLLDHSPSALLAAQLRGVRTAQLSTGFASPPDVAPLPTLRPEAEHGPQSDREGEILARVNRLLRAHRGEPLRRLAELFARVDLDLLATFEELDPYGPREGARYHGVWTDTLGEPGEWPSGNGPRVFAYLKPFPALPALLHMLRRSGLPVLAHLSGAEPALREGFSAANLLITEAPVDLRWAARDSDLAVLNAGHAATSLLLLEGSPILQIPLVLEQFLTARRVAELGMGQVASQDSPEQIAQGLQRLLTDRRFSRRAKAFQKRHRAHGGERALREVVGRIVELAGGA